MAVQKENFLLKHYIDRAMVDLPALPTVIMQIISLAENEESTIPQIEELVRSDAAIATKLLKVVNSVFFGLSKQVSDIGQAISVLGMTHVKNLTLSIGVLNALSAPNPRLAETQRQFWVHSFVAAYVSQKLAHDKGVDQKAQDLAYVGGLLHDIGRLFLFVLFSQPYQKVLVESVKTGEPLHLVEEQILGMSHATLGGMLAQKWNFPEDLTTLIQNHDGPADAASPILAAVHIADRLASQVWHGESDDNIWPFDEGALAWLGYSEEQMAQLTQEVTESVERANELSGIV